jgi:hypothetical protein
MHAWRRRQQWAGVRRLRLGKDPFRRSRLHDAPVRRDRDVVGEVLDHAEGVRDEPARDAHFGLQFFSGSTICFCTIASSAVVGSSAISATGQVSCGVAG